MVRHSYCFASKKANNSEISFCSQFELSQTMICGCIASQSLLYKIVASSPCAIVNNISIGFTKLLSVSQDDRFCDDF
jgi:hypothetical protein